MARSYFTRIFLSSVFVAALSSCASAEQAEPPRPVAPLVAAPPAAPVRAAPSRPEGPKPWPTTSFRGADYIDVRDLAKRFALKAEWVKSEPVVTLSENKSVRFRFEEKQRDFHFDGLRIFLGENVIRENDTLWITKLDVIKTVAPLFRPGDQLALLPVAAPKLIVIDPGHGGTDPGKENKQLKINEKTLTLDVALRLKKLLEAQNWRVVLTRTEDVKLAADQALDLQRRADFANQQQADLFVSIHFNSVEKDPQRVTGVETYTMAPQSMLSTAAERKDEMTNVAFPGNRLDYANLLLGEQLHRAMIGALKVSDRGYKRARFSVLRFVGCPGALVECAYLSNEAEARRAATPEYRQRIAEALAAGLNNYSARLETLHPKPTAPVAPASPPVAAAKTKEKP